MLSDGFSGGPVGVSPEVAQRNSVEIFLNTLSGAMKAARTFGDGGLSAKRTQENILKNLSHALRNCFSDESHFDLEVRGAQLLLNKRVIYENREKKKSLALMLQESGIRLLRLKEEMSEEELSAFVEILQMDLESREHLDEDLYCLFREYEFAGIEFFADDVLREREAKEPEFKAGVLEFIHRTQNKTKTSRMPEPRRLRTDDLKVIEEFRLSPAQFARSDEDIQKIVKSLGGAGESKEDRQSSTLERLALMGFHFVLQEKEGDQIQVGRDLIQQVCHMSLQEAQIHLFIPLVRKLLQLHQDNEERRGEFQKILDFIFSPAQWEFYRSLLEKEESQKPVAQLLLKAPPSAIRLLILLLDVQPWMSKFFGEKILKSVSEYERWLDEEVNKNPERACWEILINLFSHRPNPQTARFILKLYETAGPSLRIKILKQAARIGSPDSLRVFQKQLQSFEESDRMEVFDILPLSASSHAISLIRSFIESESFADRSPEERKAAYTCGARLMKDEAIAFFAEEWSREPRGFFKSKALNEKRMLILQALSLVSSSFLNQFVEQIGRENLSGEPQAFVEKIVNRNQGGQEL